MKIYTVLVYVFMFTPIVVVIVLAFNPKHFGIFPMEGVSLRWFIKLAQNESAALPPWHSSVSNFPAKTPSTPCCYHRS